MPAPVYDLLRDYGATAAHHNLSYAPGWVVAIVRLSLPLSFSRQSMSSLPGSLPGDGARTRGETLIITDDVILLHVSSSKDNHLGTAQVAMKGSRNYLVDILPDDWMLCWACNSTDQITDLVRRIKAGEPCNKWDDGLRFVGRVGAVPTDIEVDSEGRLTVQYGISGYSFKELDTVIYYDFQLAETARNQIGTWLAKIGLDLTEIFQSNRGGAVEDNVHKVIPQLFEILLGRGLDSSRVNPGADQGLNATFGLGAQVSSKQQERDAPFAYLVPEEVGKLLGRTSRSKKGGILAYADLVELLVGVQQYSHTTADASPYRLFTPDIDQGKSKGNHRYTGTPMLGAFIPLNPSFSGTPIWNVLNQFLNAPVNEMYTALRVNGTGDVVPTIVLRQIPFTTERFPYGDWVSPDFVGPLEQGQSRVPTTRFLSLPRWKLAPQMVKSVRVVRSNATRTNFVEVIGQNALHTGIAPQRQLAANQPIRDDVDIQRSGLHPYIAQVACDTVNQAGHTPEAWMGLVADRLVGSQLTLSGTFVCTGITAPIAEGDNLEFNGVVYHIESVDHTCRVSADGRRSFTTTLRVSNGMAAEVPDGASDIALYPCVKQSDLSAPGPGFGGVTDRSSGQDLTQDNPLNQQPNEKAIPVSSTNGNIA